MKKSLLFCGVAALAFASCTQSEVLDVNENRAIGFDNFVGKPTRAGETTSETIKDGFGVYGGNQDTKDLFPDVMVYYDGTWKYDNTKYWVPNKTYKFAAYAPQVKDIIKPTWSYDDNKLTFVITCDATNQNDLVYGVATPVSVPSDLSSWTNSPVSFTMKHLLSKLNFEVKAGDIESDATLAVSEVSVKAEIFTTGTYNDAWSTANALEVTFTGTDVASITTSGKDNIGTFYVIPQTLTGNVTVKFKVTLTSGGVQIGNTTELTATISSPTWNEDYVYTYVATVNQENITGGKPIQFTGSVSDWTNKSGGGDMSIQE